MQDASYKHTSNGAIRFHQLKTVSPYYEDVASDAKKVEIRIHDRDYQVGDYLWLTHYDPQSNTLTGGRYVWRRITHILTDKPYVPDGYVALSIEPVEMM